VAQIDLATARRFSQALVLQNMEPHIPYQQNLNREPDFIVEYQLDPCDELKSAKPGQGMRLDFLYDGEDPELDGIHMIWPELLDEDGNVILDKTPGEMETKGKANMWIVNEERREIHKDRINIGTKGYWVRGPFKMASVTVTQIGSLKR